MDVIEKIKVVYRAYRYRTRNDKAEIAYINSILQKGQTAIDIGAHKGGYLYNMLEQVGNEGRIYAFEPQGVLYKYLVSLKKIFNWNNVTVERIALSDESGAIKLFIPSNNGKPSSPGASIIGSDNFKTFRIEEVKTATLDEYCTGNNIKPDFLKVDVEGNELKVFIGGTETLKKYHPKILFECEQRHVGEAKVQETFQFLQSLGYQGRFFCGDQILPVSEFDFEIHQKEYREPYCNNFIFE